MLSIYRKAIFLLGMLAAESAFGWIMHRDFNSGPLGAEARGGDAFSGESKGSTYVASPVLGGSQSARLSVNEGTTGFGTWGGVIAFPAELGDGGEIWISVNAYIPNDFDMSTNTGLLKFMRIRQYNADGSHTGYLDLLFDGTNRGDFRILKEGQSNSDRSFSLSNQHGVIRDNWFNVEIYVKIDDQSVDQGGNGLVRVYIDGEMHEFTHLRPILNSGVQMNKLFLFTYWNGGAPKSQSLFMDDIIITSDTPSGRDSASNPVIGNWDRMPAPTPPSGLTVTVSN